MPPTVASFGGGVNSTAMLVGMWECGEKPDLILFADTGGEKPETYDHLMYFRRWCVQHGFPSITKVREERFTLEEECLAKHTLPSIAFGMRSCSDKFKIRPQERYLKEIGISEHVKLIGFDALEAHRAAKVYNTPRRYPLIEWGWDRDECVQCLERNDIDVPPKSSCFFCPEMSEQEIVELGEQNPDLLSRALAIEKNATTLYQIKGLAREYSWKQIIDFHRNQGTLLMPSRASHLPCMCFDGE